MISFDQFHMEDSSPIYVQIIRHIKQGIVAGSIRDGDEMPSRRVLSSLLGVNPNTVQKAYRLLEDESLIESRSGAISCVILDESKLEKIRKEMLESDTFLVVSAMKKMGVTKDEAVCLIEKLWSRDSGVME